MAPRSFYVYTHARPDGSVFYVGKGSGRRARDFSPSRRSAHHVNLVRKHGRDSIIVAVYPCASEEDAFKLECAMIAAAPPGTLINRTTGGEGASGRPASPRAKEAFRKHYGPNRVPVSPDGKRRMTAALLRNAEAWKATPEGAAHIQRLGQLSAAATAARPLEPRPCARCGAVFETKSPTAAACSKACQTALWRAKQPKPPPRPRGPQSPEARAAVAEGQRRRWEAMSEAKRAAWNAGMRRGREGRTHSPRALPDQVPAAAGEEGAV